MTGPQSPDDLVTALRELGVREPDTARSAAILATAARTMARRRKLAEYRLVLAAAAYGERLAPLAAGMLAAGFVASALMQVVVILLRARGAMPGP